MADKIKTFIVTDSSDAQQAMSLGAPCAYLFYRIGESGALQRAELPMMAKGGLMGIFGDDASLGVAEPTALMRNISSECQKRGYTGVLLDFEPSDNSYNLVSALLPLLEQRGLSQFVPISLANAGQTAKIILPSAISGGSFVDMLQKFSDRYGAENLCLEVVRSCNEFDMPAFSPDGRELSAAQFRTLTAAHHPDTYFSHELCTRYFTYRHEGNVKFVLFDDPASAAQKIKAAQLCGFYGAFVLYRDWGGGCRDILR